MATQMPARPAQPTALTMGLWVVSLRGGTKGKASSQETSRTGPVTGRAREKENVDRPWSGDLALCQEELCLRASVCVYCKWGAQRVFKSPQSSDRE